MAKSNLTKTLVILKPSCLQRALVGEVIKRFEQKGLRLAGLKMCQLSDAQMNVHYAKHAKKPFFQQLKDAMMVTPVVVCCLEGVDAVEVVRNMAGATSGRKAVPGTIRGDLSMSYQENIVHTSDSPVLNIFFKNSAPGAIDALSLVSTSSTYHMFMLFTTLMRSREDLRFSLLVILRICAATVFLDLPSISAISLAT